MALPDHVTISITSDSVGVARAGFGIPLIVSHTAAFAERVRTYNYPQSRVTDHRVNVSSYNLEQVLDGDIDQFITALLQLEQAEKLEQTTL